MLTLAHESGSRSESSEAFTRGTGPRDFTDVSYFPSQFRIESLTLRLAAAIVLAVSAAAHFDGGAIVLAQPPTAAATESDLKLAYMYLTAKFTTWPDDAPNSVKPFVIGVVEPDPFDGGLQKLEKRFVKKRPIRVVYIKSERDYQPCHLLFIPSEVKPAIANEIIKRTADQPVLVWRDRVDPNDSIGVACAFIRKENELLIEANPAELKRRNLAPDGQLMSLRIVQIMKPSK